MGALELLVEELQKHMKPALFAYVLINDKKLVLPCVVDDVLEPAQLGQPHPYLIEDPFADRGLEGLVLMDSKFSLSLTRMKGDGGHIILHPCLFSSSAVDILIRLNMIGQTCFMVQNNPALQIGVFCFFTLLSSRANSPTWDDQRFALIFQGLDKRF